MNATLQPDGTRPWPHQLRDESLRCDLALARTRLRFGQTAEVRKQALVEIERMKCELCRMGIAA